MTQKISHALVFPEGIFIFVNSTPYFMPDLGHGKAYNSYGQASELFGKKHNKMTSRAPEFKEYDLTHEIEDGTLISARLISQFGRSAGTLADQATLDKLNDALTKGTMTLETYSNPPAISDILFFNDGRKLISVYDAKNPDRWTLYLQDSNGTRDTGAKLKAQGGSHLIFLTPDGTRIEIEGWRGQRRGVYDDRILTGTEVKNPSDLAAYGIPLPAAQGPHLDPFCPELRKPQP